MALLTSIAIYAGLAFFFVGCLLRIIQYSRTPVHLRWELYPVPGEGGQRAKHGGSYFEETDWWKRPREKHFLNEVSVMLKEIFLLHGVWKSNRPLWWRSFPFHTGLYLVIASCCFSALGTVGDQYRFAETAFHLARFCAWTGLALTLIGSTGLAWRRIADKELRIYTVPSDLMNLGGFALACLLILAGGLSETMPSLRDTVFGLLTLQPNLQLPILAESGIIVGAAMTGYVPYTHMAHFIAKYFTYHLVRWDDTEKNKAIEAGMAKNLAYHPTWSASHIAGDGKKSWTEIVTTSPAPVERISK